MAKLYEWKRGSEYATTDSPDKSPPGEGWARVYSFGIGSVAGAGGSPARRVDGNRSSTKLRDM